LIAGEVLITMLSMRAKRVKLSEQIRRAILASDLTRYQVCKRIGLSQSTMSRFIHRGGGLSMEVVDALADVLDINLESKPTKDR
jgi:transcriptional regulator with XRE-family HTH domain